MRSHFQLNGLLSDDQHGFRPGHSCETAIHEIVANCYKNLDKKLITLLLFVDFKKAFDMVNPDFVLLKLFHYGFDNNSLNLLRDYFRNRCQITRVNGAVSTPLPISMGVPQGSVLGPLLFLIYINDLPAYLDENGCKLFADDTTVECAGESIGVVNSKLGKVCEKLIEWCDYNMLLINWSKTFVMYITSKRVARPKEFIVQNNKIEAVEQFKLLGVIIDNKLTFSQHVSNVRKSIFKKLYSIKRLFYLSFQVKLQFFKTFILPYFDYCISLSMYFNKSLIQKLSNLYSLCLYKLLKIKLINLTNAQVNARLKELNLMSFTSRVFYRCSVFCFKLLKDIHSPLNLKEFFKLKEKNNAYNLRSNNFEQFDIAKSKTKYGDLVFGNLFGSFLNHCFPYILSYNFKQLNTFIFSNFNEIVDKFFVKFPKFHVNNDFMFYK
jgi:hypothetical protein